MQGYSTCLWLAIDECCLQSLGQAMGQRWRGITCGLQGYSTRRRLGKRGITCSMQGYSTRLMIEEASCHHQSLVQAMGWQKMNAATKALVRQWGSGGGESPAACRAIPPAGD